MDPNLNQPQTPNNPLPPDPQPTPQPIISSTPDMGTIPPATSTSPAPVPPIQTAGDPSKKPNKTVITVLSIVLGLGACLGTYFIVKSLLPSGNNNSSNSNSSASSNNNNSNSSSNSSSNSGSNGSSDNNDSDSDDDTDYSKDAGMTKTINFDTYSAVVPEAFSPYTIGSKLLFTSPDKSIEAEISVFADDYEENKARVQKNFPNNYHVVSYNNREYTVTTDEGDETYSASISANTAFGGKRVLNVTLTASYGSDTELYDLQDFLEDYIPAIVDSIE